MGHSEHRRVGYLWMGYQQVLALLWIDVHAPGAPSTRRTYHGNGHIKRRGIRRTLSVLSTYQKSIQWTCTEPMWTAFIYILKREVIGSSAFDPMTRCIKSPCLASVNDRFRSRSK